MTRKFITTKYLLPGKPAQKLLLYFYACHAFFKFILFCDVKANRGHKKRVKI
jgi:hypothetical protein